MRSKLLAPIVIFAFNRERHLRELFDSLKRNEEFADSPLFVFLDGPRSMEESKIVDNVQKLIETELIDLNFKLIRATENQGLSNSILAGIDIVLAQYDRVIVLEDDLIVSPVFLKYCNENLDRFSSEKTIASIQGFSYPFAPNSKGTYFLRGADCWGWATWSDRWASLERDSATLLMKMRRFNLTNIFDLNGAYPYTNLLSRQAQGKVDSWAIRWHASMFLQNRLSLYPYQSLVSNRGEDGSGTHAGNSDQHSPDPAEILPNQYPEQILESKLDSSKLSKFLRAKYGTYSKFSYRRYKRKLKELYRNFKKAGF